MANALFDFFKEELHDAAYNLITGTVKQDLIDTADDNPDTAVDDFYDDITGAAVEATATLGSKSNTTPGNGAFDAADGTWSAVTGDECEEVLGWLDTAGAASTDPLIYSMDTFSAGMPVTPNGGDINFTFNASGIFSY